MLKAPKISTVNIRTSGEAGFIARKASKPVQVKKFKRIRLEFLAMANLLGLAHTDYANLRFSKTKVYGFTRTVKKSFPRHWIKSFFGFTSRLALAGLMGAIICVPFLQAFEAHIINLTAEPAQIDPPVLQIPGPVNWSNPIGGTNLMGTQSVTFSDSDEDANFIFYTFQSSTTSAASLIEPTCGQTPDPQNGGGPKALVTPLSFTTDTVIKAIACNSNAADSPSSVVNIKVYHFKAQCPADPVDFPKSTALLTEGDAVVTFEVNINGNAMAGNLLATSSGGPSRVITGDATTGNSFFDTSHFSVAGSIATGTPPLPLPDLHQADWKNFAALGGHISGSLVFATSTTGTDLGPAEISGSLVFGSNNTAAIRGPLYVHGDLVVGDDSVITEDGSFGESLAIIIVDGKIRIGKGAHFIKSGASGAVLLVSNDGSSTALVVDGDLSAPSPAALGDVVLFAQNGGIYFVGNRSGLSAYAQGQITVGTQTNLDGRDLPDKIGCGFAFSPLQSVLINEFLPHPTGGDQGIEGGSLDGEWVELFNGMDTPADVNGWVLYDNNDSHALTVSTSTVAGGDTVIQPGGHLVVYRDGNPDFDLNHSANTIRLFTAPINSSGVLVDLHSYNYPGFIPLDKSFARTPDGTANWVDPEPTKGEPNTEFVVENYQVPNLDISLPPLDIANPKDAVLPQVVADTASTTPEVLGDSTTTPTSTFSPGVLPGSGDSSENPDNTQDINNTNTPPNASSTADTLTPPAINPASATSTPADSTTPAVIPTPTITPTPAPTPEDAVPSPTPTPNPIEDTTLTPAPPADTPPAIEPDTPLAPAPVVDAPSEN